MPKKLNGTVIVTYRCNARCNMCNRYKAPSDPKDEISIETIKKLPEMYFTNITGGEPFIREDIKDIVRELRKKSDRIVISTNGFFTASTAHNCRNSAFLSVTAGFRSGSLRELPITLIPYRGATIYSKKTHAAAYRPSPYERW